MNTIQQAFHSLRGDKPMEEDELPLYVRPIFDERKIRKILNIQDPRDIFHHKKQQQREEKMDPMLLEQQQQRESSLLKPQQETKPKKEKTTKKRCYWREFIHMDGFPVEAVKAFWSNANRCVIVTAKCAELENGNMRRNMSLDQQNRLGDQIRWDEEKNLCRLKHVIPVPKTVCAKDLECFVDTERSVFILCARRHKLQHQQQQQEQLKSSSSTPMMHELDKDCQLQGHESDLHQRCQPLKALLQSNTITKDSEELRRGSKYVNESPELYYASKQLREQIKEIKRASFPGLMRSPRFVKDEKTQQWILRLQFRLRNAAFRPEDVQVRVDEKRRVVIVEAQREVREGNLLQTVHVLREFSLPEVADLSKLKQHFVQQEGVLRIDVPLVREKFLQSAVPKQQQQQQQPLKQ